MSEAIDLDEFRRFEVGGWTSVATPYDRFFEPIVTRAIEPLLDMTATAPGDRLLDYACGPGYVAARAEALGAAVVGVDFSREMTVRARSQVKGADFVEADGEQTPFAVRTFDVVIGGFILPHLARPELAMSECVRVLVPGGRIGLSTWNVPSRAKYIEVFADAIGDVDTAPVDLPTGPSFFRFADDEELTSLMREAGFEEIEIQTLEFDQPFASTEVVWSGLLDGTARTGATVRAQTTAVQAEIRAAFDRRMEAFRTDDAFALPVSIKLARAALPSS